MNSSSFLSASLRSEESVTVEESTSRSRQLVLREKPSTPYIVLPNEEQFKKFIEKPRYSLDMGGTLCKVVYTTVCHEEDGDEPVVLLNFRNFTNIEECVSFLKQVWPERQPEDVVHCTGGGAFKYEEFLMEELAVRVDRCDEMRSLIKGIDFLLKVNLDESFSYHPEAVGIERFQYKTIRADDVYPFLLVNIGTGISMLKVSSPSSYERVGGTAMGGGFFLGMGQVMTGCEDFEAILEAADAGDNRKVDSLVGDIHGGDYLGLPADMIAGSFGKLSLANRTGVEEPTKEDHASGLLTMVSDNIGVLARLYANKEDVTRIYFGGSFIRQEPRTMEKITKAVSSCCQGSIQALYLKHEGYLGAVGSFLNADTEDSEDVNASD